jgi:hypothetical protein
MKLENKRAVHVLTGSWRRGGPNNVSKWKTIKQQQKRNQFYQFIYNEILLSHKEK